MKLKELFSYYNPNTNKIENCDKGSLLYLHEYRHYLQNSTKVGKTIVFIEAVFVRCFAVAFIVIALLDKQYRLELLALAGVCIIPTAIVTFIHEIDAWIYAIRFYKRK
jgi:hypothetical protein